MLVANSFDLWQKDTFFSAAEEVQQSADMMESAYRTWIKARNETLLPQCLDELSRQLQMALGTAKWQLEEFERAVTRSYRNSSDEVTTTITRHKQFVSAIEDQISRVEAALKDSFNTKGMKPFRWVNLDEEECDDLAHFITGVSSRRIKDDEVIHIRAGSSSSSSLNFNAASEQSNSCSKRDEEITSYETDQVSSNRRTCSPLEKSALEIIIHSDDKQENTIVEATPKEKGSKPFFWIPRGDNHFGSIAMLSRVQFNMISWLNQHLRGAHRSQRQQLQQISSPSLPVRSMRYVLVLLLTIFLVVPFLLCST